MKIERQNKIAIAILVLFAVFLLALQTPLLSKTRDRIWQGWIGTIGTWFRVGSLGIDGSVDRQLAELTAENVRLKAELRDLIDVRRQVGSAGFDDYEKIAVRIAPMPLDPYQIQYMVNKGAADGVQIGAPVIIDGPVLIGFVSELEEYAATVQLLFHPEASFSGEISVEEIKARGLVTGELFTGIKMVKIPRDIKLAAGMEVVTSEEADKIPGGILVGRIEKISDDLHEPYQQAYISVPYRKSDLRAAAILISP